MRLPFREVWRLRRIECRLRRSEPHLAAMLAIFARLNAAEAIISREQARPSGIRAWRVLAVLAGTMAGLLAGVAAIRRWASRRTASACAATLRWIRKTATSPLSTSVAGNPPGHGRQ